MNRVTTGFGVGMGLVIVGFEFEYGHTRENLDELAPGLRTYMFNGLLQTPIPIAGMQFYGTAGGGVYRESLNDISETNVGINVGGGVKVNARRPAAPALRLPDLHAAGRSAPLEAAALLRGAEPEVLKQARSSERNEASARSRSRPSSGRGRCALLA